MVECVADGERSAGGIVLPVVPRFGSREGGGNMKWLIPCVVAVCLLAPQAVEVARADAIPARPVDPTEDLTRGHPTLSAVAGGVVAIALTASWFALRNIRKRDEDGDS
jgi:hypothetical protein